MAISVIILVMITAYTFLEFYYRARAVKVTWLDRIIGGVGGVLLLVAIQLILASRGEFGTPQFYLVVAATGLPAVILMFLAWVLIKRRQ